MSNDTGRKAGRIVFAGKQQVSFEEFSLVPPQAGWVRVKVLYSLMSTGTENIVFNQLYDKGTHWDDWVKYPFYPGYCAVGVVEDPGESSFVRGSRVAVRLKHQSEGYADPEKLVAIPEAVPWEEALWFALAKITFQGASAAEYKLGDRVLVIGAGPIGQMSIRWARAAGAASIVVVDSVPERLELARAGGASAVISRPIEEAREEILGANGGRLPGIVVDSTGNAQVFASALSLAERFGRVVLIGDTGRPGSQALTSDVMTRGVRIYAAHDCHERGEWNQKAIIELFFTLAASGRFPLRGLNTHFFDPKNCGEAYATVNRERGKTMGVVFDWTQ